MTSTDGNDATGIVFPMLPDHIERFFGNGKKVFVKYFGKEKTPRKLKAGSRLFFYESGGNKQVVGDARIARIESGTFEEVLGRFGDQLFLTRAELERYAEDRRGKRMLVLVLEDARKYAVPLRLTKGLTMAGQYMTKTMLAALRAKR